MKVFYNENQTAKKNSSMSPSAGKPALVAAEFKRLFGKDVEIVSDFAPLSPAHLSLAHDPLYVREVLKLKRHNGFGNTFKEIADSLPWTSASMYAAAREALKTGLPTCSLTSGFHHACYSSGGGFCTFNGLMITAQMLRLYNGVQKIGIIDLDAHHGNGTEDIIRKLGLGSDIMHYSFSRGFLEAGGSKNFKYFENEDEDAFQYEESSAELWLSTLEDKLSCIFECSHVILAQMGADAHINDPLGGYLTSEQMKRRDEIVFKLAKKYNKPIAWNLAGGYQKPIQKVLDIHNTTAQVCLETF